MNRNAIIINGISSTQFPSLLIEELPSIQLPQKKVEVIEVDGRSGSLTITDDCYKNIQKTMRCKLRGNENIDDITMWLYDCKEVIFSNREDRYYKAIIQSQVDFERSLVNNRSFSVTFDCQPFGYLLDNETISITKNFSTFMGKGSYWSEPIIRVFGSGDISISINDCYLTLKDVDGHVTVNTEKKRTHRGATILNNKKIGDFPILSCGENSINWVGAVSKIEIVPNWRCLV